jgi:hypothetical protein
VVGLDEAFGTRGIDRNAFKISMGKSEDKIKFRRLKHIWKNNIKKNFKGT